MLGMLGMCFVANTSLCVCWHPSSDTEQLLDLQLVCFLWTFCSFSNKQLHQKWAYLYNGWHPVISSCSLTALNLDAGRSNPVPASCGSSSCPWALACACGVHFSCATLLCLLYIHVSFPKCLPSVCQVSASEEKTTDLHTSTSISMILWVLTSVTLTHVIVETHVGSDTVTYHTHVQRL